MRMQAQFKLIIRKPVCTRASMSKLTSLHNLRSKRHQTKVLSHPKFKKPSCASASSDKEFLLRGTQRAPSTSQVAWQSNKVDPHNTRRFLFLIVKVILVGVYASSVIRSAAPFFHNRRMHFSTQFGSDVASHALTHYDARAGSSGACAFFCYFMWMMHLNRDTPVIVTNHGASEMRKCIKQM